MTWSEVRAAQQDALMDAAIALAAKSGIDWYALGASAQHEWEQKAIEDMENETYEFAKANGWIK